MKDDEGNQVTIVDDIKVNAETFFKRLYYMAEDDFVYRRLPLCNGFPNLNNEELAKIQALLSDDEIRNAIFSRGVYKAPVIQSF